jgi:hypothetical protein
MIPAHRKKILAAVDTLAEQIVGVRDPTPEWKDAVFRNINVIVKALPEPDHTRMVMTVPEAQEYFVNAVQSWREHRDRDPAAGKDGEDPDAPERRKQLKECAPLYVDAFQSAHLALFGELVPGVDKPENQEEL